MRSFALIGLALVAGCFYIDPINQRPGVAIRQLPIENADGRIHRGEPSVKLEAIADDPEAQPVKFHWTVQACTDGTNPATCDETPLVDSLLDDVDFAVPTNRADPDGDGPLIGDPVETLLVTLEGRDEFGARSRPRQELVLDVLDAFPDVAVDHIAHYDGVVNAPIDIFAVYGDLDDSVDTVTIAWQAFSPTPADTTLTDIAAPPPEDLNKRQVGKRLVPSVPGPWMIEVKATDDAGESTTVLYPLVVELDGPPCIAAYSPIAPSGGAVLPVSEPTLFQVPVVTDALDSYPTILNDPLRGATTFEWSIKPASGPREIQSTATGNSLALDPSAFTVGDIVEVRVEVFDRNAAAITCTDTDQTCAIVATNTGCIQRQTWKVEVR